MRGMSLKRINVRSKGGKKSAHLFNLFYLLSVFTSMITAGVSTRAGPCVQPSIRLQLVSNAAGAGRPPRWWYSRMSDADGDEDHRKENMKWFRCHFKRKGERQQGNWPICFSVSCPPVMHNSGDCFLHVNLKKTPDSFYKRVIVQGCCILYERMTTGGIFDQSINQSKFSDFSD